MSEKINVDLYSMNCGKGVIMGSGTTNTYLHESITEACKEVRQLVKGGRKYSNGPVKMETKDPLLLPVVLIQLATCDDVSPPDGDQMEKYPGLAGPGVDPDLRRRRGGGRHLCRPESARLPEPGALLPARPLRPRTRLDDQDPYLRLVVRHQRPGVRRRDDVGDRGCSSRGQ